MKAIQNSNLKYRQCATVSSSSCKRTFQADQMGIPELTQGLQTFRVCPWSMGITYLYVNTVYGLLYGYCILLANTGLCEGTANVYWRV